MRNIIFILSILVLLTGIFSCSFMATGVYMTNLAEGWRNYTDDQGNHIEVIPQIPNYQYFNLKWNGKVKWFHYENNKKIFNGIQHWEMKADTVIIKYHSPRMHIDTVLFKRKSYEDKYWFSYMYTDSSRASRFLKKCFGDGKVFYAVNKYSDGK